MITKNAILAMGTGALRADDLSPEDKKTLAKAYGLSPDSSFRLRNALRGELGGTAGGFVGGTAGALADMALFGEPGPLTALGTLGGGIYGIKRGTDKYSKSGVEEAREILRNRSR